MTEARMTELQREWTELTRAKRREAAEHERQAAESFERCDTDGFVSQWASGMNAAKARAEARIAEAGGQWRFERTVLETLDGEATDGRMCNTRYGQRWRLDSTDEWLPFMPARESTLAKKGYRERIIEEIAPAKAIHWSPSGGTGLSGATSVQTIIIRTDLDAREGKQWRPAGSPEEGE